MSKHAELIFIRGLPGSGKSYLTTALQAALDKDRLAVLDPDAVDRLSQAYQAHVDALTAEGVETALHLYRYLRAQAYQGIEAGKIIIWNQPFTNLEIFHKMIGRLRDHAREHEVELSILIVEVEADPTVARGRVAARKRSGGHGPSETTFERFVNDYQSFADEGYKAVTVSGADDVDKSVRTVLAALGPDVANPK